MVYYAQHMSTQLIKFCNLCICFSPNLTSDPLQCLICELTGDHITTTSFINYVIRMT